MRLSSLDKANCVLAYAFCVHMLHSVDKTVNQGIMLLMGDMHTRLDVMSCTYIYLIRGPGFIKQVHTHTYTQNHSYLHTLVEDVYMYIC